MAPTLSLSARRTAIGEILLTHEDLWRPAPFTNERLGWCTLRPTLAGNLRALTDSEVKQLSEHPSMLASYLAAFVPELARLAELSALERSPGEPRRVPESRRTRDVPGRKLQQIERFLGAAGTIGNPAIEWCAGKGHLGRVLNLTTAVDVVSLERDRTLCASGAALASRAGAAGQRFAALDAHESAAVDLLAGRHALALHACGDLHRTLVHGAIARRSPALHLAPCCYHKTAQPALDASPHGDGLTLTRADLRFAVADSVTAGAAEVQLKQRAAAWKLGYLQIMRDAVSSGAEPTIHGIPTAWIRADFESFCRRVAERDDRPLPADLDWRATEQYGWRRYAEIRRLDLLRAGFRRALELWIVLGLAAQLEQAGYEVTLTEWCARELTPRNLMIGARLPGTADAGTPQWMQSHGPLPILVNG